MKTKLLFLIVMMTFNVFSQDNVEQDTLKTRIFSLSPMSPMSPKVGKINGFVLGVGHYGGSRIKSQKINGFNLEASPLGLALISFGINIPFEGLVVGINDGTLHKSSFSKFNEPTLFKINGLNISTGGFMEGAEVNGVNISVLTKINEMNGLSINGSVIGTHTFNGVSIAGIANISEYGNGLQVGISNVSRTHTGVQIGLFNYSKNLRGLQFGLWNTNGKRRLPFINWQFKD